MSQKDKTHGHGVSQVVKEFMFHHLRHQAQNLISNSRFLVFQICFSHVFSYIFSYKSQTESFALYGNPRPWIVYILEILQAKKCILVLPPHFAIHSVPSKSQLPDSAYSCIVSGL